MDEIDKKILKYHEARRWLISIFLVIFGMMLYGGDNSLFFALMVAVVTTGIIYASSLLVGYLMDNL